MRLEGGGPIGKAHSIFSPVVVSPVVASSVVVSPVVASSVVASSGDNMSRHSLSADWNCFQRRVAELFSIRREASRGAGRRVL